MKPFRKFKPSFDCLENRALPSVTLTSGLLDIVGTSAKDNIRVQMVDLNTRVEVDVNHVISKFDLADVSKIRIDAGAGNDKVFLNANVNVNAEIHGNVGNDRITGGSGDDTISGDSGNDKIDGGAGKDTITGDDGNDQITGGADDDLMEGGNGNDRLLGGTGKDTMYGNAGNDVLQGNDDDDKLSGDDGNDKLSGGNGNDFLSGGAGDDHLDGGANDDTMRGGEGNDNLNGGDGVNELDGDTGNDKLSHGDQVLLDQDFQATLTGTAGAFATAKYEADQELEGEVQEFELEVEGLVAAGSSADVYIKDGISDVLVGQILLDASGNGKLVFVQTPEHVGEQTFPANFPQDIAAGSTITLKSGATVLMQGTFALLPSDT